ncbi:MAG: oxidoreductase [Cryobacterium sp.]|jgi:predicted dinucleotide-binding enzyme|nr:oxidoreductase [Cryobacterium sp.]
MSATDARPTLGMIGAGRVGTAVARQALAAGYEVRIAGSGDPAKISLIASVLLPGAIPVTAAEAASLSDLVVVAVPLNRMDTLPFPALRDKVVVDAMNYWAPTDGTQPEFETSDISSSEVVAARMAGARVVKTLNHIGYHELEEDGRPAEESNRRALALAGDDEEAKRRVAEFIDRIGFDPVDIGPLSQGQLMEPGTTIFSGALDREGIEAAADVGADNSPFEVAA